MNDLDAYRCARLLLDRHGRDAELQTAMRADELGAVGDEAGREAWMRILAAVDELARTEATLPLPRPSSERRNNSPPSDKCDCTITAWPGCNTSARALNTTRCAQPGTATTATSASPARDRATCMSLRPATAPVASICLFPASSARPGDQTDTLCPFCDSSAAVPNPTAPAPTTGTRNVRSSSGVALP